MTEPVGHPFDLRLARKTFGDQVHGSGNLIQPWQEGDYARQRKSRSGRCPG